MRLHKVVIAAIALGLLVDVVISYVETSHEEANDLLEHREFTGEENVLTEDDGINGDADEPHIIFVSTMDGKITALDVNGNGDVLWSLNADDQPLLSGTFGTHQEMFAGEEPYTIVPSLDGSLFMLGINGGSLRPVPITADISQVINGVAVTGGSVNSKTGIDPITGEIKYRCTSGKCEQTVPTIMSAQTLVLTRNTQTARAADPLTGSEKWNLSVGEYTLQLFDQNGSIQTANIGSANDLDLRLKPPVGVVALYECGSLLWEHSLGSPIARVWQLFSGQLTEVSLFDPNHIETLNGFASGAEQAGTRPQRFEISCYLGCYKSELYIIPSDKARFQKFASDVQLYGSHRFPSRGYLFLHDLISVDAFKQKYLSSLKEIQMSKDSTKMISLPENCALDEAILVPGSTEVDNEDKISGGWYIKVPLITAQNLLTDSSNSHTNLLSDGTCSMRNRLARRIANGYRKYLLHNWWQIGGIMTLFIGLLSVIFLMVKALQSGIIANDLENKIIDDRQQSSVGAVIGNADSSSSVTTVAASTTYVSKFFEDFTPIRCLGRGGYGVVFNCKHKLDDRNYAVKRITVSNTASAIERVTREAKAMAKLEHPGIIRYFHTWIEKPPAGWQQAKDKEILEQIRVLGNLSGFSLSDPSRQQSDVNLNHLSTEDDPLLLQRNKKEAFSSEKSFNNIWVGRNVKPSEESSGSWLVSENPALNNSSTSSSNGSDVSANELKPSSFMTKSDENSLSIIFAQETDSSGRGKTSRKNSLTTSSSSSLSSKALETPLVLVANDLDSRNCRKSKDYIYLYIQMELCQDLTLHNWLLNNKDEMSRDVPKMRSWFAQLVCAVNYIHEQGLIHRDIKNTLKIGDLGLATNLGTEESSVHALSTRRHTGNVGTRLYMSPEQLKGEAYNQKVDVFSLGLIFTEMLIPFQTVMERHEVLTTLQTGVLPSQYLCKLPKERSFINWLTTEDPNYRPSCAEIIGCEYLKGDAHLTRVSRQISDPQHAPE